MLKSKILQRLLLLLLILTAGGSEALAGTYTATVRKTYVNYNDPNHSYGVISQGTSTIAGYNAINGSSVGFGNTGWGVNYITYVQVDASGIPAGLITGATLTAWVTGSTDSKRQTTWGVGYNSSTWSDSMTYNTADKSITTVGDQVSSTTTSASVWEEVTFDITDALKNDADKVVTLIIYETAAGGGYIDLNSTLTVEYAPYHDYTVRSSVDSKVLATGTVAEGIEVTTPYPRYQLNGTTLYKADKKSTNPNYGHSFTVTTDNQVETITYNSYASNIVTYKEAETFLTPVTNNNYIYIRCSDTGAGYTNEYTNVASLPSGAYKITAASYANSSTSFTFQTGDNTVFTHTSTGAWSESTSGLFQVPDGSPIQVRGGTNNYALDYVYIEKVFAYQTASSNRTYNIPGKPTLINSSGAPVTYSSDNTAVATVDGSGNVSFIRNGTATITARATIDGNEYTATHTVVVTGQTTNTATIVYNAGTKTDSYSVGAYEQGDNRYLNEVIDGTSISLGYGSTTETQMALGNSIARCYDNESNMYATLSGTDGKDGIPYKGTFYVFTPKRGYNGKLTVGGRIANTDNSSSPRGLIRLTDANGNVIEKKSLDVDYSSITFNTLLMGGSTYYVYAETTAMRKDGSSPGDIDYADNGVYSTFQLTGFSFVQMEGTTINLIDQSLLLFPDNNANQNRLDRRIPGFDITFGGGDGAKYQNTGTFIFRNREANSEAQNGSITITPRIKAGTGSASDVVINSVKLNTGSSITGSPSIYINNVDKGAVTANSTLDYTGLTGNALTIKLKGSGAENSISFLLNSITISYMLSGSVELDDTKGTVDLRFANDYVYGHTGETKDCDVYFNSPVAFYGDVGFWGDNWTFGQASTGAPTKTKVEEKTHIYYNGTSYKVNIGTGVCHLGATFNETDYFATSYASTRLYSYDYVETPSLVLAPGASYKVPAANGLGFSLTTTGSGTVTLTGVSDTSTPAGTTLETTATGSEVVITNSGSESITITRIEVQRLEPELSYGYNGGQGDEGNVFFPDEHHLPTVFTVKEGDTDISDKYETSGTYTLVRAPEGVTINASTGEITVSASAAEGYVDVQLTVNPKTAYQDLYGPVSKSIRLYVVNGMWDFRTYKYADHQSLNGSSGWGANNYNQARDTEFMEELIRSDGEPLSMALALKTQYKMRMTYAKNNGDGRMHLFGKGSNEQNRARYDRGGILRVPVKKGMQIEINAYSNGERSDMTLDGCNDILNTGAVTTFYVNEYATSQYFIANRDGYIDIINPSSNLDLYINYIKVTDDMVFYYGEETYTDPGGTFNNPVTNQGETTLAYSYTNTTGGNVCDSIAADGTVTQRVGAYGSYKVTVTGSGEGLLAGKTGKYTVHAIGFSVVSPVSQQIDATLKTTFTPKNNITITNSSGLDNDVLKSKVEYTFMSMGGTVAYFSGDNLIIEGVGDVVLQAHLGSITRTMVYRVTGASLNDEAPVITNTQGSYTVVINGGDAGTYNFDTGRMTAGILGNLKTPTFTQNGNKLIISDITGAGGTIPIYASCTYSGSPVSIEGVLTVAYSSHVWNFESDMIPRLGKWTPKDAGSWTDAASYEEPVDASANNVDTKDWCFVRKMGVTHPESSIVYYYTHSVIGTNALVIPETAGLYLRTTDSGKQLGVEMDNERINNLGVPKLTNGKYACRNLMILRGGQFVVPKVKPGQWIEVRWTRHQDDMAERLVMQNLCDVEGKYINEVYKIGNCFYNIPGQTSTYMFQVNPNATPDQLDADGRLDAVFEVADNIYISIQQIELHEPGWQYDSSMAPKLKGKIDGADDAVEVSHQYVTDGNTHTIEFLAKDSQNAPNAPQEWTINTTGNLNASTGFSKTDGGSATASITYRDGWGKVYVTLTSYSQNLKYVANRNTWVITIGARPQQSYPYTWDFTKYFDTTKSSVGGTPDNLYTEDPNYSDASVADKATDETSLIQNPSFTDGTNNWTLSTPYGGAAQICPSIPNSLEYWAGSASSRNQATFDYYQTLTVPNGYYILTADMYNSLNNEGGAIFKPTICLYTNNGSFDERTQVDREGTDFHTYSTDAIKVTNGTLRIGVKCFDTSVAARWFVVDNFRLTRIEYYTGSTRAHEMRKDIDTWTESINGNDETVISADYDSRKYRSYYVDGAQLVSHTLGILPETEGLGFRVADKTADNQLTLDMQSQVTTTAPTRSERPSHATTVEYPHTWRNGKLTIKAGGAITVPSPGSGYDGYYLYIRCNPKPASVTNTSEVTDDVAAANHQYKYHFTANADAVITFDNDTEVDQIGVTNIFKTMHKVGGIGWSTESRNHHIDHALTGHLTVNDANAYTVKYDSYDMETATVALTTVDEDGYVPSGSGIVLKQESSVPNAATYQVPLFVPAVTTAETSATTTFGNDNLMKANINENYLGLEDNGGYTKFILTNVHWKYTVYTENSTENREWTKLADADAAGFYRLHIWHDARDVMPANSAYLQVPTAQLPDALWNTFPASSSRRKSLGIREVDVTDPTSIPEVPVAPEGAEATEAPTLYHSLDGRRVSTPKKGLYIRNGRKVVIK